MKETKKNNSQREPPNSWIKYSGMGIQMAAIIGGGTYGGILLDHYFQLEFPAFTITLTLLSVFAAIYYFIKDVLKK